MRLAAGMAVAALLLYSSAAAQERKPLRVGLEAGGVMSNFTGAGMQSGYGFYVGARGTYDFGRNAYAAVSLRYIQKGSDGFNGDADGDRTYTPGYMELPVAVGVQGRIGRRLSLFGETGPYIAYGICGKDKGESFSDPEKGTITWNRGFFSSESGSPRRYDWGWHARAGARFSHVEISVSYERGFLSVWKHDNSRNTCWLLGVGYRL